MKALFILILAVAAGFAAYRYAYDPIVVDYLGIKKEVPVVVEAPKPVVVVEAPKPVEPPPMPEPPKPEPAPMPVAPPPAPMIVKQVDADGFELPEYPPIEEAVKGWTAIPKSAFPREVKLMKPVEFVMSIGKSSVGAGGTATAVAQDGAMLIVAPTPTSQARSSISIDDTDLKASLTAAYENWKVQRTAALKRRWQLAKLAASNPEPTTPGGTKAPAANNTKPAKAADGTFTVLLDSMKAGQVTEVTPQNITKWEDPVSETVDGKDYWVVVVGYTTKTMFGDFPTAAKAFVHNGRVEKWLYKESGEVVP